MAKLGTGMSNTAKNVAFGGPHISQRDAMNAAMTKSYNAAYGTPPTAPTYALPIVKTAPIAAPSLDMNI